MNDISYAMLISLLLTVILEEVFVYLLKVRSKKNLLLIVFINLLTNPPTVLTYYLLKEHTNLSTLLLTLGLEIIVILVEYFYLKDYGQKIRCPLYLAIGMNVFSYSLGKMINILFL